MFLKEQLACIAEDQMIKLEKDKKVIYEGTIGPIMNLESSKVGGIHIDPDSENTIVIRIE